MTNANCVFCDAERKEFANGIKICELSFSRLYLFREQLYPYRCLLASKSHTAEVFDLPEEERKGFLSDLDTVSAVLRRLSGADKMNFLSLGDTVGHIHIPIVPKKETDPDWGGMFHFMDKDHYLTEELYAARMNEIRGALEKEGLLPKQQ